MLLTIFTTAGALVSSVQAYVTGINPEQPPHQTEQGQSGYNDCLNQTASASSQCQNVFLNDATDFCLFSAPYEATVGEIERVAVSYCTTATHGARLIPEGTFKSVHFLRTPNYVQITGTGDFTKIKIKPGDAGGELDPHGYDGLGNPVGGLVFTNARGKLEQLPNWDSFISDQQYCFRACFGTSKAAKRYCNHIYDVMGCDWNIPGSYVDGVYEECMGDNVALPQGEYLMPNGATSTWSQGVSPTPTGQPPASSSLCKTVPSPTAAVYGAVDGTPADAMTPVETILLPAGHAKRQKRMFGHPRL